MKKQKNLWSLLAIMMVAMASLFVSSCSSDDDDGGTTTNGSDGLESIVGDWYYFKTTNGVYSTFDNILTMHLDADKTGSFTWAQYTHEDRELNYIYRRRDGSYGGYNYDKESGILKFTGQSGVGEIKITEIGENTMTCQVFNSTYTFVRGIYDWSSVSGGTIIDENGTVIQEGSSSDDNNNTSSTDPQWGRVTGKIKAYGTEYSAVAKAANGKSTTVDYVYYPSTGKYYVYGGTWDSNSSANGGKGVRYDAHKGYNSIRINGGAKYDHTTKMTYTWEVYLQVTIP